MECLTLEHEGGAFEIACNLKDWRTIGPKDVLDHANSVAKDLGVQIVEHYTTGPSEEELIVRYDSKISKR